MLPLSLLTLANLNFTLCKPECDPFLPWVGNWYYIISETYLNFLSLMTVTIIITLSSTIKLQMKLLNSLTKKIKLSI